MAKQLILVLLAALVATLSAELVQFEPCDLEHANNCIIHQVNINPCAEAEAGEPCRIRRGRSASILFDFTPEFSSNELSSRAFWVGQMGSFPWVGMETNACRFSTCPTVANERQSYNYTLSISKKYSARVYNIQWRLWDEEERMKCCFATKIRLV